MPTLMPHTNRRSIRIAARSLATLTATLLITMMAGAQPTRSTTSAPDLQGIWDFTMRVGSRTSTGFLALGPVGDGWAGSITPDSTNTLAIRMFTVQADSIHMIVASREGDVPFHARLSADARSMEGIVHYHGGALYPMTATRRVRRP